MHGGDLFDRPDVPIRTATIFSKILQSYGVPIYIISGNHDTYGQNPDTIERSMLGLLSGLNIVHLIDNQSILLKEDELTVQVHGTPYRYDIDRSVENYDFVRHPDADYAIQMVHGFLLQKPFIKGIHFTLIDDLYNSSADLVLSGHYHTGYSIVTKGNTTFLNPGSLVRMSNSKRERERIPQVALIEITKDKDGHINSNIELCPLKSADKGEDVFSAEEQEQKKIQLENLERFKQTVRSSVDLSSYDILGILKNVSDSNQIESEITSDAVFRIKEALKEIGDI